MVPCNSLLQYFAGVLFFLWGGKVEQKEKREFYEEMLELKLKQAYYIMEHKEANQELADSIKELSSAYKKKRMEEKLREVRGEKNYGKH